MVVGIYLHTINIRKRPAPTECSLLGSSFLGTVARYLDPRSTQALDLNRLFFVVP